MNQTPARRILVTSALPYANGAIHLGHLVEYIQTDIWVRFQKMSGNECWYVCADDTHGTPIMLAAEKAGITPEAFIAGIQASHERDFAAFGVAFDHYDSTNSAANRTLTEQFYQRLDAGGHISRRTVAQFYDPAKGMFLPDRYIKGICPNCGSADQYGDNCEVCGATYAPTDLKEPTSILSGSTPEIRDAKLIDDHAQGQRQGVYFPSSSSWALYDYNYGANGRAYCNGNWRFDPAPIDYANKCQRALPFVRSRKGPNNDDWVRSKRQQRFIYSAIKAVASGELSGLASTAQNEGGGRWVTNMPISLANAQDLYSRLHNANLGNTVVFKPKAYATRIVGTSGYELKLSAVRAWCDAYMS